MKRSFQNINQKTFDLIVIGGGIIGTGVARDAALRGLDTLLVEKEDFAYGTTSRSTRLIHGGLRYLRMLDFKLVWKDLHEREILLHIAPHLVQKLEFCIPLQRSHPMYRITLPLGLCLYDIMATGKSLPSRQHLSLSETLQHEPALADTAGLVGSLIFYDCQARNMERLCLENVLGASEKGACILNHAEATDFLFEEGTVKGVKFQDRLSGENYTAKGRVVLNAGGPWANLVWNKANISHKINLRRTKGIHLLTRKLSNHALILFAKSDGRLFFIIPWNDCSLIGTTDTDYSGDLDSVGVSQSDVEYLITETRNYFPHFKPDDIYYTMAGLRPLVPNGGKDESNTSRAHKVIDHEGRDKIKGLISILGGKITAYRAIAEEATNLVCRKLKIAATCSTTHTPLPGAPGINEQDSKKIAHEEGLPVDAITNLAEIYGSRLFQILDLIKDDRHLGDPIKSGFPDIRGQIKHAVMEEEALTVSDFLLRRSTLGLRPDRGRDIYEAVAHEMGLILGWNAEQVQKQIQNYKAIIDLGQSFRKAENK